jgi:hypothetical protein
VRRRTRLAILGFFLTPGCLVPSHESFETPLDTVRTFQSRLARDDEFGEYQCMARSAKEELGLTQQQWSAARGQLLAGIGCIGRFVLGRNSLEDNVVGGGPEGGRLRLDCELAGTGVSLLIEPEATLLLPDPGVDGGVAACPLAAREFGVEAGVMRIEPEIRSALADQLERDGVTWAELTTRWKLAWVEARDVKAGKAPEAPEPAPTLTIRDAIGFRVLSRSLGAARVRLDLRWPPRSDGATGHDSGARRVRWETPSGR